MIPRPADRGRAEVFAAALEAGASLPEDGDVDRLVRTAEAVCRAEVESPRPLFAQELRDRLMSEAPTALAPPTVLKKVVRVRPVEAPAPSGVRRRLGALAATFALAGGSFGLVTTSAQALPGQMLYPVKRGVENAQVAVQRGPSAVGSAKLDLARTRLAEVRQLVADGDDDTREARLVSETLDDFSTEASQGADSLFQSYSKHRHPRTIETLSQFTRSSARTLSTLSGRLPEGSAHSYAGATSVLTGLNRQADQVCSTCHVTALAGLPASLRTQVQDLAGSANAAARTNDGGTTGPPALARDRDGALSRDGSPSTGRHRSAGDTRSGTPQHGRPEQKPFTTDLPDLPRSVVPERAAHPRDSGSTRGPAAASTGAPDEGTRLTDPLGKVVNPVLEGLLGSRRATDGAAGDDAATDREQPGDRRTGEPSSNGGMSGGNTSDGGDRGLVRGLLDGLTGPH